MINQEGREGEPLWSV